MHYDSCVTELLLLLLLLLLVMVVMVVLVVMVVINIIIITDHHHYYNHHHSLSVFSGTRRFPCLFALFCPSLLLPAGPSVISHRGAPYMRRTTEYTTTADFFNDGERNFGFTLPKESQEAARFAAQIGSVRLSSSLRCRLLLWLPTVLERLRV
eukprot:COSAG05_NODE_1068_length_5971_cov_5.243529_4_plen_153_part_00